MKKKQTHTSFDTPETLLVVSLYPKKGETYSAGTTGVASYTKNLVTAMNRPVVVLADLPNAQITTQRYQEKNTLVSRCFKPNQITMWAQLLKSLLTFKRARTVLIQFDFSMYGSMLTSAMLLPFIALLRIFGFKVSVVSHHVVTDVRTLSGHMGLTDSWFDSLKALLFNLTFNLFYLVLGWLTNTIIVLEESLQETLKSILPNHKVKAIPHAVDTSLKPIAKTQARKQLSINADEQVVLFFGFANWFKGADLFASFFQSVDSLNGKPARFILAGGESVTLKEKQYYQEYFQNMLDTIDNSHRVEITGYVPQEKVASYFSAADLVVFPYRTFMCASGVLSLTFSYQKPFIISEPLTAMLANQDFQAACDKADLKTSDMSFKLNTRSAVKTTEKVLHNGLKPKLKKMCRAMRELRSFDNNALLYEEVLFGQSQKTWSGVLQPAYAYFIKK